MALYLVIQVGAFLSRYIPRPWRYLIGTAVGDAVFWAWSHKRRILLDNMATVLSLGRRDPLVRRLALKSMRNYVKYLVEFLELPVLSPEDEIVSSMPVHGLEHLQEALQRGKGVILATAHFGTIELAGMRLSELTDFHAVYDSFRPEYLDRLIQRKRREKGIDLIPVNDVRKMIRVLRRGGTLAMLFDRPMDLAKGVNVHFFGRPAAVPGGPAVLALRTGATIIPAYVFRQPDRTFMGLVFPAVDVQATGDYQTDVQRIMQRLVDTLQSVVRERPDQWYMFRPVWQREADAQGAVPARRKDAAIG
ncbi:MAG TPA: lysophospholipid acyltransferase family protein [Chloroflexota bacterium]|nr:lysophospholipid acyltransferase family protein [Chloroflexota bacterium]